jgi:hypothetical protein
MVARRAEKNLAILRFLQQEGPWLMKNHSTPILDSLLVRVVQPRLLLPAAGGDLSGCGASVQVYEQLTGWTTEAVQGK